MRTRRWLVAFAATSASLALSIPALADAPAPTAKPATTGDGVAEARTRYNRGVELYNDGDYKLALIEFQRSYELAPNWRVLYNIGEVQFQLTNYSAALKSLERYLAEGGAEVPEKRKGEVQKDIESLRARTGFVTIVSNVEGADVLVDEASIGKTPLPPNLLVDGGSRKIVVSKAGYRTETKSLTIAGKDHASVEINLEKDVATGTGQVEPTSYVWVGWVGAGALATGAVVTGILSLNAKSDADDLEGKRGVTRGELDDADAKRRNFSLATDILVGATIVVAGVSLYFTIKKPERTAAAHTTFAPTQVRAGVGPGSVVLTGTF